MPSSDAGATLERTETAFLIASDRVEGTPVYGTDGTRIGKVEWLMIDKRSGKVAYAVMSFGGLVGIGADYHPIPWAILDYDETLGGYRVNITEQRLKAAPKYSVNENWDWSDQAHWRKVHDYWGASYYWT